MTGARGAGVELLNVDVPEGVLGAELVDLAGRPIPEGSGNPRSAIGEVGSQSAQQTCFGGKGKTWIQKDGDKKMVVL